MAQYKVPQDVEAEDKLLGPFTFRQFVYLMIIGGLIGLGILFWQFFSAWPPGYKERREAGASLPYAFSRLRTAFSYSDSEQ